MREESGVDGVVAGLAENPGGAGGVEVFLNRRSRGELRNWWTPSACLYGAEEISFAPEISAQRQWQI